MIYSPYNVYPSEYDEDGYCDDCGFCEKNDYCPQMVEGDIE